MSVDPLGGSCLSFLVIQVRASTCVPRLHLSPALRVSEDMTRILAQACWPPTTQRRPWDGQTQKPAVGGAGPPEGGDWHGSGPHGDETPGDI